MFGSLKFNKVDIQSTVALCLYFLTLTNSQCSNHRSAYLSLFAALNSRADVFHTDQISLYNLCLAVLRPNTPIVFYCHFSDKLLASRSSLIRTIYRMPFDAIRSSLPCADTILCNSEFTRGVFCKNFRTLRSAEGGFGSTSSGNKVRDRQVTTEFDSIGNFSVNQSIREKEEHWTCNSSARLTS